MGSVSLMDAALLALLACAIVLPLLLLGVSIPPVDHDFHSVNAARVAQEMEYGSFYPRWFWSGRLGLGEPTLLYYAPAFPLLSGLLTLVGLDPWTAVRAAGGLACFGLAFSAYLILGGAFSRKIGWIGALLAALNPLALHALYFTGYWPMYLSQIPALWLAYFALMRRPRLVPIALLLGGTVLCHPLMGFMLMICLPLAAAVQRLGPDGLAGAIKNSAYLSAGLLLGVALSSFYLLPALLRQDLIGKWESPEAGYAWVFALPFISKALWPARHIIAPLPLLAALLAAAFSTGRAGASREWQLGFIALGGVAFALATELAWPLYQPALLGRLQFAWRFLFVAGIGGMVGLSIALATAQARMQRLAAVGAAVCWLVLGAVTAAYCVKTEWPLRDSRPSVAAVLANYVGQPEYLVAAAGPDWQEYLERGGFAAECERLAIGCALTQPAGAQECWSIESDDAVQLTAPVFAMEGIRARLDERPIELTRDPATGLARVALPAGGGSLCFHRDALPQESAGAILSALALLLAGGLWVMERKRA